MYLSQKEKIKKLLLKGKPVHMRTLNNIAYRYGGRLFELRKEGFKIDVIQIKKGEFVYRLTQ
jgi:hypothetical protein